MEKKFDIFLSHSFKDADLILGIVETLKDSGVSVYVDWIEDGELDRAVVTPANADRIRQRMKSCSSLVYATSRNTPHSKWMPWELGYFDGYKNGSVAIFPIVETGASSVEGQEFIGLYPTIESDDLTEPGRLWVKNASKYPTRTKLRDFIQR